MRLSYNKMLQTFLFVFLNFWRFNLKKLAPSDSGLYGEEYWVWERGTKHPNPLLKEFCFWRGKCLLFLASSGGEDPRQRRHRSSPGGYQQVRLSERHVYCFFHSNWRLNNRPLLPVPSRYDRFRYRSSWDDENGRLQASGVRPRKAGPVRDSAPVRCVLVF